MPFASAWHIRYLAFRSTWHVRCPAWRNGYLKGQSWLQCQKYLRSSLSAPKSPHMPRSAAWAMSPVPCPRRSAPLDMMYALSCPPMGRLRVASATAALILTPCPASFTFPLAAERCKLEPLKVASPAATCPSTSLAEQDLLNRPKVYGYDDDPFRFAFFSRAVFELAAALGWRPDVVHANDWHTAPAVAWLDTAGRGDERFQGIPSLFTIHNLRTQGRSHRGGAHCLELARCSGLLDRRGCGRRHRAGQRERRCQEQAPGLPRAHHSPIR